MNWLRNSADRGATAMVDPSGAGLTTLGKPRLPSAPTKITPMIDNGLMSPEAIADYRATCEEIGMAPADILVEEFRHFLAAKDIPVFKLSEVVAYMDDLVSKDNPTGFGWHWAPVRPKDAEVRLTFGRPSRDGRNRQGYFIDGQKADGIVAPSSDFYESHQFAQMRQYHQGGHAVDWRQTQSPAYTRTMPLHALKKIATVEREYKDKVIFLVTEYTNIAHMTAVIPDPFLMAVIPNSAVAHGKGRFIIDVWDEPGFGIKQMLA